MFENDHNDVKYNHNLLKNIKTGYILFNKLIKFINRGIKYGREVFKEHPIIFNDEIIDDIKKMYNKYVNENICLFFNEFTLKYCDLMSIIYLQLFKYLNLKYIHGENMILTL